MCAVSQLQHAGVVQQAKFLTITHPIPSDKDDRSAPEEKKKKKRLMDGCSGADKLRCLFPEDNVREQSGHKTFNSLILI